MVHPTELLRSDSEGGQGFSAPVGNYFNDIDCGIAALPFLTQRLRLDVLAKLSVYCTVLSLLGLVHGIISSYFRGTAQLWFTHYNFPNFMEDWFIYLNEIFVGVLALCISYWGDRLHRATCMGALTMLIAVSGATLAIPEVYNPFTNTEITNAITGPALCTMKSGEMYTKDIYGTEGFNEVTFGYFFVFQIMFSMVTISFITHGLSYVDDHISAKHSPALLGLALGAHEAGKQFGIYFSWVPYVLDIFSIFLSPVWIVLVVITFIIGVAMAMFPKVLPNMVIKKSVNSLVSIASGGTPFDDEDVKHGFWKIMRSLLTNKLLLLNIFSYVLIQSALTNFSILEKYFNQSKYHVPLDEKDSSGYSDPDIIQFTTNLLQNPLVAVCYVTCGTIISKLRPKPKYLVIWNIVAFTLVLIIFSSTVFLNCTKEIQNEHKHAITIPFCSSKCGCPNGESFQPVCVDGKTYFSPCLAGCRNYTSATMVYSNCHCGTTVTAGSCDQDNCKFILALAQVNDILINAIMGSAILVNVVITLRSTKYKATALGLELTCLGIITFVPVKIIYQYTAGSFCAIRSQKGCQYFSKLFPIAISSITVGYMLGAIITAIMMLCCIKDIKLYTGEFSSYAATEVNNAPVESPNTASATPESRTIAEDVPFIRQLSERVKSRIRRPLSREERIQTYIEEGDLVPPLETKKITPRSSGRSAGSNNAIVHMDSNGQPVALIESRPNSRNSKRHSKASGESDLSSLYRFADSIVDSPIGDPSDGNESEPSLKVSQGKIVFQTNVQNLPLKTKKPIFIAPDKVQPQRPAPVPDFLVETNL